MTEKCCPRCGKVHPPMSPDQEQARAMAQSLAEMLMHAARDACQAMRELRPDFLFLPVIIMNVVNQDDRLMATTCEFPGGNDREDISNLLRLTAEHIENAPEGTGRFTATEVSDDPTKH